VNLRIEISVLENSETAFKSIIQGVGENTFTIQAPTKRGETLLLHNGDKVKISFFANGAYYFFDTMVVGRVVERDIPLYRLAVPADMERVQKRNYVRLDIVLEIHYQKQVASKETGELVPAGPKVQAFTRDISGGGMQFISKEQLAVNSLISIELQVADWKGRKKTVAVLGKVLRVERLESHQRRWSVGVVFDEINERDRDAIISFIFRKALERHRLVTSSDWRE